MNDTNTIVQLDSVSKQMGEFCLQHINLIANPNDIIAIIGENGAGKTTFLKILSHLYSIDSGKISLPPIHEMGFVFDSNHLHEALSVKEIERFIPYLFQNWDGAIFSDYIDKLEIPREKAIKDFSKGMKTKLGSAVALSHHARVLLLDEITSGLDPLIRDEVLTVIKDYVNKYSAIAIMTTHLLDDVLKIANKVIVMNKGSIILNQHVSEYRNTDSLERKLKEIIAGK